MSGQVLLATAGACATSTCERPLPVGACAQLTRPSSAGYDHTIKFWEAPSGICTRTLKDAMNEAMRDWVTNVEDTFYIIGTVAGASALAKARTVLGIAAR